MTAVKKTIVYPAENEMSNTKLGLQKGGRRQDKQSAAPTVSDDQEAAVVAQVVSAILEVGSAPEGKSPASLTKRDMVLEMLRRPEGATAEQIMAATGWQAHSVRGFISGTLKNKLGHVVTTRKGELGTIYVMEG